ncbi:hypothetical protein Forpi1262_v016210 [Fusarium oxysporum f. sp. raphani]|uniref:Uncharacterized protein n=1 Tax=Fusarium oxysporum f. sp. raphani TaxID=96318 RepID=A0A8J5PJT4_FUSOX|nr:hypothetical protein Forpi1262_v016210 [Fusarium oxysporum f. sp. raphani]
MRTNSQEDLLRFEEQTPWIERTGWDKTYHGRSRDALAALAAVSFSRGAGPHLLGRQGTNGLHEDIFSIMEDERKVAAVLEALDALLDRCEDTARKPSRSILCWLRSTHALAGYPKPFILPSSRRKYRVLFKRCLLLIFRSYRMDPSTRDKLTGIRFKRKQFRFLKAIWNHESLSDLDAQSPRTRLSLPGTETSYLGGFTQRCLSHNYSEDEREDDDEESVTESSEEDYEYWSDESQIVRHTGNEEPKGDEQVSQELIELLFGLSPSLCTEQVTNGQPSSTLLVFFSGILGFSSSSGAFLPAKLYTPYLSGLLKKDKIQSFMSDHEEAIGDNRLLVGDLELLGKAHTFLQPFASAALYAEGDDSSISQSLMLMDMLLLHYEEQQKIYQSDEHSDERMVRAIDMGWFILSKYYRLTDEVPVYAAALLLDPPKRQ